ncbi:excalibur calcium-binding domain-containing protein [Sporosarcina obsidiansis]|uniref:excalibur calcium-binding domain-containing protein n=1 Tax=Sporosarcina obsidiansis TaxID=2660748 RepID=UPI00129B312B|nr:excalibur calcium-binding domain-containing protein [Sporosarcina obsidiansis]
MKKLLKPIIVSMLAVSLLGLPHQTTEAAPVKYKNCKELNKAYPGGVAMNANVKNKGGKTKYKPSVSPSVYNLHKGLDRDKDGIACER